MSTRTYCHSTKDIPKGDHFAIIEFGSMWVCDPYDQDGGSNVDATSYIAFTDKAEWEANIVARMSSDNSSAKNFVAIKANTAEVVTQHIINVKVN